LPAWINGKSIRVDQLQGSQSNLTAIFDALLRNHRGEV
jgi:hypothetical protein